MSWSWRVVVLWWLVWSAAGVVLIVLPDSGPRLLTFSGAHGPGLVDAIGVVLLLVGNAALWRHLWRARAAFTPLRPLWTFLAGLGAGLVLASVTADFGAWWAVGATLLLAVQAALFLRTTRA
ncbi:MAG TPA: hypothetical protein VF062_14375 [Candidatus Limnocylindrales bacterium]